MNNQNNLKLNIIRRRNSVRIIFCPFRLSPRRKNGYSFSDWGFSMGATNGNKEIQSTSICNG